METGTAIILLGAAGVGGFVLYRALTRQPEQPGPCGGLGALIGGIAGTLAGPGAVGANSQAQNLATQACNLLGSVKPSQVLGGLATVGGGVVKGLSNTPVIGPVMGGLQSAAEGVANAVGIGGGGASPRDQAAHNIKLNGPGKAYTHEAFHAAQRKVHTSSGGYNAITKMGAVDPSKPKQVLLEHANGCVPFQGAPGWSKCAPGTQSTHRSAGLDWAAGVGTGTTRDAYTFKHPADAPAFPIQVPTGSTAYWIRGQPVACERGLVLDKRPGRPPVSCGSAPVIRPPDAPIPPGPRDHRHRTAAPTSGPTSSTSTVAAAVAAAGAPQS